MMHDSKSIAADSKSGGAAATEATKKFLPDSKCPTGPMSQRWTEHKFSMKRVNPANKRKYTVIVVGSGLAGASAAASLGELGYNVLCFCFQDSPRRAHSIAAQGGINAAKNYQNDGDSVYNLFYDTIKGGDFRARESNVFRLAEVSNNIIDQCVAQGVPFAREYGGMLDNRSFGGSQVSRTFYARGQTGQQLLLGAYSALSRQIGLGTVKMYNRHEMLDLVLIKDSAGVAHAKGIVTRDLVTGEIKSFSGDSVILATGGYGNVFYLSTNAQGCNVTATYRAYKRGAGFANPCYTQIHPTCIPVHGDKQSKLTLMSESLRNDGRIWVPKNKADCEKEPSSIPEQDRDYYLERKYPSYGNLAPRDISSRSAKEVCDAGNGVGPAVGGKRLGVYLDFADSIKRLGAEKVKERYDNLFEMYERITGEDAFKQPMRIYPAVHYTMGGLWVDYNLQTNIPGLFCLGEANFSDHGANRLGASALMQGLADGYFVVPYTVGDYLARVPAGKPSTDRPEFKAVENEVKERMAKLLAIKGKRSPRSFHQALGNIMWDYCGMARNAEGLKHALKLIPELREEFYKNVNVVGQGSDFNQELERAGRVADFLDFGALMCQDALDRDESCGGHFRTEHQYPDGEAKRNDEQFAHVSVWEFAGDNKAPIKHKEELKYEEVKMVTRSYK
ncbi:MAG: fumarate reductase/succinate dehydrogenase flavoprotein subunit [Verrucomicrobiota bacterium]|nr:fumarate reductase/succinate dehydrogenase flavoprotein subunit [Verrucomicrobiota bacterium]